VLDGKKIMVLRFHGQNQTEAIVGWQKWTYVALFELNLLSFQLFKLVAGCIQSLILTRYCTPSPCAQGRTY
jgi:hypothetical protein